MRNLLLAATLASCLFALGAPAQSFSARYEARATRFQADQPKWIAPVVSPYPMLVQIFRAEFSRQLAPNLVSNWNLGNSKGINLIPLPRTEVDLLMPPFFEHGNATLDGFGDFGFTVKYRLLSANEKKGSYLLTAYTSVTIPTGSYKNGATNATITPSLGGGKGYKKFDAFTTLGATLPTGNTVTIGRAILSNSVFQYHAQKYLWPELEINATSFYGGTRDGKIQTFITPGLMIGKYSLRPHDPKSRLSLAAGVAFQSAATHYHAYNHAVVLSGRLLF